jgi:hypothetical protein
MKCLPFGEIKTWRHTCRPSEWLPLFLLMTRVDIDLDGTTKRDI